MTAHVTVIIQYYTFSEMRRTFLPFHQGKTFHIFILFVAHAYTFANNVFVLFFSKIYFKSYIKF